jgi:hypothetical protein
MCGFSTQLLLSNSSLILSDQVTIAQQFNGLAALLSFKMVAIFGLNNFCPILLSPISIMKLQERPA